MGGKASCRTISPDPWQPKDPKGRQVPWRDIALVDRQYAAKLQRALQPLLEGTDTSEGALARFSAECGYAVRQRRLQQIIAEIRGRDGGRNAWDRVEIYLPGKVRRKVITAPRVSTITADQFPELAAALQSQPAGANPPRAVELGVWLEAVCAYDELTTRGMPHRKALYSVLNFMQQYPWPNGKLRGTLNTTFNRYHDRWLSKDRNRQAFLHDGREDNGQPWQPPEADCKALIDYSGMQKKGLLPGAWRDLVKGRKFSEETTKRFRLDTAFAIKNGFAEGSRLSYVPAVFRAACAAKARAAYRAEHEPRQTRINSAAGNCDWSGLFAGEVFSSDDCTLPVYFWIEDDDGNPLLDENGKPVLKRGQFLPVVDARSKCILDWVLLAEDNYDSYSIRSLFNRVFDRYGVPPMLQFEKGLWKNSKLLWGPRDWQETKCGAEKLGLRIHYAHMPQEKIVENILLLLQARMTGEPGYSSTDERRQRNERFERHKQAVLAGRVPPSKYFYSYRQWCKRLEEIVNAYNEELQESIVIGGQESPINAWRKLTDKSAG